MALNLYDKEEFFQKYAQMPRSQKGLAAAGEWHELKKLFPDFREKAVLDLGCGYGWHCRYAAEQGALRVLGVDCSQKMLDQAAAKNSHPKVQYQLGDITQLELPAGAFQVIISSLAFHYVEDFSRLVENMKRWLSPRGELVFSVEHPIFTAQGPQDWHYGPQGEILHFPVDNYSMEGERKAVFLGESVKKFHRTLASYLNTMLDNGFTIKRVIEPTPPEDMMELPGMRDELRRPMMLLMACKLR